MHAVMGDRELGDYLADRALVEADIAYRCDHGEAEECFAFGAEECRAKVERALRDLWISAHSGDPRLAALMESWGALWTSQDDPARRIGIVPIRWLREERRPWELTRTFAIDLAKLCLDVVETDIYLFAETLGRVGISGDRAVRDLRLRHQFTLSEIYHNRWGRIIRATFGDHFWECEEDLLRRAVWQLYVADAVANLIEEELEPVVSSPPPHFGARASVLSFTSSMVGPGELKGASGDPEAVTPEAEMIEGFKKRMMDAFPDRHVTNKDVGVLLEIDVREVQRLVSGKWGKKKPNRKAQRRCRMLQTLSAEDAGKRLNW